MVPSSSQAAPPNPVETDTEVGVLGDVVGIPAADRLQAIDAEMVGRTAERDRQATSVTAMMGHPPLTIADLAATFVAGIEERHG